MTENVCLLKAFDCHRHVYLKWKNEQQAENKKDKLKWAHSGMIVYAKTRESSPEFNFLFSKNVHYIQMRAHVFSTFVEYATNLHP